MDKNKTTAKNANKKGFFARIGNYFKESFSELKKVSWPTFGTVVKTTLMVLAVVAVFLVLLFVFDLVLKEGYKAMMYIAGGSNSALKSISSIGALLR